MSARREFWGAHAFCVLVSAFCRNELSLCANHSLGTRAQESSFSQNAKTSTLQACAPRNMLRAFFLVLFTFSICARADQQLPPATIVVYNSAVPESVELAKFYAEKRGIASDHLVALTCSREEEISREEYDQTIAEPLREIFNQRKWWALRESAEGRTTVVASSIRIVALIKGMPLKIRATENYPGDKSEGGPIGNRNEACVDSELAILPMFRREISGAVVNPFFQSYRSIRDAPEALLLVCRLDAPSASTVRRMITDAIETEKRGLWGRAYVDGAHNTNLGFEIGDRWLVETVEQFHKAGVPVVFDDSPALFPDGYPMSDCALYYGWYAGGVTGPFAQNDFRFTPGAIAVHIHSFSASTLRNPNANWVGPLLTKGAAASVGNVYEPYLQLSTHLDILNDRLLHGFSFAESTYMATQTLSWMTVMVGDPLYRPYASWLQIDASKTNSQWSMYHEFALQNSGKSPEEFRNLARQVASRTKNAVMIEDLGLMEMRDGKLAIATTYFQQARALYTKRDDILRVVLEEAEAWKNQDKPKRAVDLVRSVLKIVSDTPTAALLKKIDAELAPKAGLAPLP
ncbi:MAG: TIGR03790 family protein [Verrucomicrobiota bacterium]|nr:TIGR03790 family protein [Verrucomicrobiota bacterium]